MLGSFAASGLANTLKDMLTIWRSLLPVGEDIFLGLERMS